MKQSNCRLWSSLVIAISVAIGVARAAITDIDYATESWTLTWTGTPVTSLPLNQRVYFNCYWKSSLGRTMAANVEVSSGEAVKYAGSVQSVEATGGSSAVVKIYRTDYRPGMDDIQCTLKLPVGVYTYQKPSVYHQIEKPTVYVDPCDETQIRISWSVKRQTDNHPVWFEVYRSMVTEDGHTPYMLVYADRYFEETWQHLGIDGMGSWIDSDVQIGVEYLYYVRIGGLGGEGLNGYVGDVNVSSAKSAKVKACLITYENLKASTHSNPNYYVPGTALELSPAQPVPGYTFDRWNPMLISAEATGPQVVRATWKANVYSVVFHENGGTGIMDNQDFTYDVTQMLLMNSFIRYGYSFVGWATTPKGSIVYNAGEAVRNLTTVANGVVDLYAVWDKIVVPTPVISVGMDAFSSESTLVTIDCATDGATVYYTTDGSAPTSESAVYEGAVEVCSRGAKTIKAMAIGTDDVCSEVATLEICASNAPTVSPTDGTIITSLTSVNIASDNPNATIYCTTDGTEPTLASPVYSRFKASKKMTVKAMAVVDGMAWSETTTARYALGQCADPSFSSADGTTFSSSNYQVSISKNGDKGILRYTTVGSEPTEESAIYTAPIAISETTTIKARVFDEDYFDSAVVSATFVRQWNTVATPVIESPKTFSGTKCTVVLSCDTVGAVIRYTTDGSDPNSHSAKYVGPFDITETTVVKAIALKTDCKTSDVATKTITKEWGIGDALNDPDRTFTGGSDEDWVRDTTVSHDGVESMRSGPLGNSATTGLFAESTIFTVVNGRGTVTFWWKASCEEDDEYEWDHGEFRVDDVVVSRINGASAWTNVSYEITSTGAHTLKWVYCKDDFGKDHGDCLWLDQFGWNADDSIPNIGDTPSVADVKAAVAGAADPQIATKIDEKNYNDFRDWAGKVKTAGGSDAGAQGVMNADTAWFSFALGQDTLLETPPTDEDLEIEAFEPALEPGKFDFTVSVKDIEVGSTTAAENLKKVFCLEGGSSLQGLSSENVDITFGTPANGKVKFTAGPNAANADAATFFMKVKLAP